MITECNYHAQGMYTFQATNLNSFQSYCKRAFEERGHHTIIKDVGRGPGSWETQGVLERKF